MSWVWHKPERKVAKPQWDKTSTDPFAAQLAYIYAWERRCRGYDLFPQPVTLEPAWIPFDSGIDPAFDPSEYLAFTQAGYSAAPLRFATLRLPSEQKVTPQSAGAWLQSLSSSPVSFEIIGTSQEVLYQVGHSANGHSHNQDSSTTTDDLGSALAMHFPLATVEAEGETSQRDALRRALAPFKGRPVGYGVVDFGLLHMAYQPLQRWSRFAFDPLSSIVNILGQLSQGEVAGLQVLFAPARAAWASALQSVASTFSDGKNPQSRFSGNPNDPTVQASAKTESPLFAVVVRVFGVSQNGNAFRSNDQMAFDLCRRLGQCLAPLALEGSNALLALDNQEEEGPRYGDEDHFRDLLSRQSRRHGMLLSLDELVGLVHPPCETLLHPKLVRPVAGEEPLPSHLLQAEGTLLGLHPYRGEEQQLVWPDEFRNRHLYLLGATRMGKSTLLLNLIRQDLEAGRGLCLIDPHGDLAKDVLALVPAHRAQDTIYLDFADRDHPPAIGMLQAGDEWEARLLCSDLLSILRRLFASSWGDRLEHILRHVLLTLLADHSQAHTLRDIRPLLSDKAYRARVLANIHDLDLQAFWRSEFLGYAASTFSPIYNKLGLLLSSPIVRNIVAQSQSKLQLSSIMGNNQILLVNLNQSLIGEDNAHFLGAMLVSKLQIVAMQSLRKERASRTPFTLYVDEFQNFIVSSFEKILSEAGKAGLSLVMANQFLEQLPQSLQSAIMGNVGTLVSFRVSSEGGRLLEKELAGRFTQKDMVSLHRGEAVARIGQAKDSFFIKTLPPPELSTSSTRSGENVTAAISERTRNECCRSREDVEAELAKGVSLVAEDGASPSSDSPKPSAATAKKPRVKKQPNHEVSAVLDQPDDDEPRDDEGIEESGAVAIHDDEHGANQNTTTENLRSHLANQEPECFGVPDDDFPHPVTSMNDVPKQNPVESK